MQTVNISDLRANLLAYLQKVRNGEELTVTSHGQALAMIVPPTDKREKAKKTLRKLSETAVIGDIVSPNNESWKAMK